jgi:hypothetical protein
MRFLPEAASTATQIVVALLDAQKQAKDEDNNIAGLTATALAKVGGVLLGKPYLGGLNSVFSSASGYGNREFGELPATRKLASALVPGAVKDVGVVKDTLFGRPRKVSDNVFQDLQRRAGATGSMVNELNTFGEPVTHPMSGKDRTNIPKYKLLMEAPPPQLDKKLDGYELTQKEYHQIKQELGKRYDAMYTMFANDETFMQQSTGYKKTEIDDEVAAINEDVLSRYKDAMYSRDIEYADPYLRKLKQLKQPRKDYNKNIFPFPN